jgi:hypothetical protein
LRYGKYASFLEFLETEVAAKIQDAAKSASSTSDLVNALYDPDWPTCPSPRTFRDWLTKLRTNGHELPTITDMIRPTPTAPASPPPPKPSRDQLAEHRRKSEIAQLKREKKQLLRDFHELEVASGLADEMTQIQGATVKFKPPKKAKSSELFLWAAASDWHVGEVVDPAMVNGINEYNPDIAKERAERYFERVASQVKLLAGKYKVETLGLWLGGDMLSGTIHDDIAESNDLGALGEAEMLLPMWDSGIRYLLEYVPRIHIVASDGNHGRITEQQRVSTRGKYSLELFMYKQMRERAKDLADRVTWQIDLGILHYVDVFGYMHRFSHGDSLRFGGGVGGLIIPLRKRIAKWDEHQPSAYTVIGHFHQLGFPRTAMTNGSLIGFNAFAQKIGAAPELPAQLFWAIHPQIGRCYMSPIVCT